SKGCQLLQRSVMLWGRLFPNFSPLLKGVPITSNGYRRVAQFGEVFQSPSQRGANYFERGGIRPLHPLRISVPFSKGCQLLLRFRAGVRVFVWISVPFSKGCQLLL